MYALTYPICLFLSASVIVVLKLFGLILMGWLWLYLAFFLVGSLGIRLILVFLRLKKRRQVWQPR